MYLQLAHTKFDVFQSSKLPVLECYKTTKTFPDEAKFALTQQIRRAALSVHLNVAEGSLRKSAVGRKRFFEVARGSVIEADTAFDIAVERGSCNVEALTELGQTIIKPLKILSGMDREPITHHSPLTTC